MGSRELSSFYMSIFYLEQKLKSKSTAHFALIFRLKFDALGVGTNNLIFTSRYAGPSLLQAAKQQKRRKARDLTNL